MHHADEDEDEDDVHIRTSRAAYCLPDNSAMKHF
jgi:hypothetical protein